MNYCSRLFVHLLIVTCLTQCAFFRIDPWHYRVRSDVITSPEQEREILSRAKLAWTPDGRVRVLYLKGTAYERGYQQGVLLRSEIQINIGYFYRQAIRKFYFKEVFDEAFERARPYIPKDYLDEMHGLAHGAKVPLSMIHHIHILPEIAEWGGKKQIKQVIKQMMTGDFETTCSNLSVTGKATEDGRTLTVRILDWGLHRISKLHQYPLIAIHRPITGHAYANIGWVGFIGAISGMNDAGITLGEMGYGSPPNETLHGEPMPFLLRDILAYASNLEQVRSIISNAVPTNSYVFLMSDGKNGEAEMYVRDPDRFLTFKPGADIKDGTDFYPAIQQTVYGGRYADRMASCLAEENGRITPTLLMNEIIPKVAMPSNFQNVIYDPAALTFWVSNAASPKEPASGQPYTYFDFGKALQEFEAPLK